MRCATIVASLLICSAAYASECRKCGGTGRLVCSRCNGTGTEIQLDTRVICSRCDGPRRPIKRKAWSQSARKSVWVTVGYIGSGTAQCNICRGKGYRGRKAEKKKLSSRDRAALLQGFSDLAKESPPPAGRPKPRADMLQGFSDLAKESPPAAGQPKPRADIALTGSRAKAAPPAAPLSFTPAPPSEVEAPAAAAAAETFDWRMVYYAAGGLGVIVLLVLIRRARK